MSADPTPTPEEIAEGLFAAWTSRQSFIAIVAAALRRYGDARAAGARAWAAAVVREEGDDTAKFEILAREIERGPAARPG